MLSPSWLQVLRHVAACLTRSPKSPIRTSLGRDLHMEERIVPAVSLSLIPNAHGPEVITPGTAFDANGRGLVGNKSMVSDNLLQAFNAYQENGPGWVQEQPDLNSLILVSPSGEVAISATAPDIPTLRSVLIPVGFVETAAAESKYILEGWLPMNALPAAAQAAGSVNGSLRAVERGVTNVGLTTSQADWVMQADRVRAALPAGFDGAGVKIGVLSDSYNALGGAAADVASGDLPGTGNPLGYTTPVQIVEDLSGGGLIDEGRAMLQLVHDVAPASPLAFATAFTGTAGFANNIRALADPGLSGGPARVIVDDVSYYNEPFYMPGVISEAVREVVSTRNVNYFSSAGNIADQSYESLSVGFVNTTIYTLNGNWYDFDPGPGVDVTQRITIPAGVTLRIALQWDDPFFTTSGSYTLRDLDVVLFDASTGSTIAALSGDANNTTRSPYEGFVFSNPSGSTNTQFDLAIWRASANAPARLKYLYRSFGGAVTINEYANNQPTIFGHAAEPLASAVAAVPYFNQRVKEPFTSSGPTTWLFDANGNRFPVPQTFYNYFITAPDNTNTTFFGGDSDGDGRPNFSGTSAAAPHAAAVAALVRQAHPGLSPVQVYQRLIASADGETNTPGFDKYTGWGLIDAYKAVFGSSVVNVGGSFQDNFDTGGLGPQWETYSSGGGRIQVTNTDGPISGSHVILQTRYGDSGSTAGPFGLNTMTMTVNPNTVDGTGILRFSVKGFNDVNHAMPATWTGTSNSDGVAFSVDGNTWYRILSLTGANLTNSYVNWAADLRSIAAGLGITLTNNTRIRFQQYGNANFPNSGIAFDNISFGVNQAPSFTKGADQSVNEDSGPRTVSGWATGMSAGTFESSQSLSFEITSNTNPGLFSAGPAIAANGTLTFTPASDANGSATIGVRIRDNGGTAGGGTDASPIQTFVITVNPVNDAPSFTRGTNQAVLQDSGPQTIPNWAAAISAGPPDESGQTLNFQVSNNNNALFSTQPAIDSTTGTLTFTPADGASGTATVTVQLEDNGGVANGGQPQSPIQQFTITVFATSGGGGGGSLGLGNLNRSWTFTDQDGDTVVVSLTGPGTAELSLSSGGGPIQGIQLSGTDPQRTMLNITVRRNRLTGGDGQVDLGQLTGSGLRGLNARTTNLTGPGILLNGYIGSINLANVLNGADITVTGTPSTLRTVMNFGMVGDDTDINLSNAIGSLRATSFGVGSITAPSVGTIMIRGPFEADITLNGNGVIPGRPVLGRLNVSGAIFGSDIRVNGNVGMVSAQQFLSSTLYAGYTGPTNGSGTFGPAATINSFRVTSSFNGFVSSHLIASVIRSATLRSIDPNNGGTPFGILADLSIGSVSVSFPAFRFGPKDGTLKTLNDFRVGIV